MPLPLARLVHTSPTATGLALLLLRLGSGGMMAIGHGLGKLRAGHADQFPDPLGIGNVPSYIGAITGEFFCGLLIAVGLFTRPACIPIIFTMLVAAGVVHRNDPFFMGGGAAKEPAVIYLVMFVAVLLAGPGKYSLDHVLFGHKKPA
jgi:putative oxidoreductase